MTTKPTTKSKSRKVLGTTLGKAPSYPCDEPVDLSHVRKPIDTSIFGLNQVLRLFETATDEVRRYVAFECDLIYECRVCRTIFRSLANFILHKRNYCTESSRCNITPNLYTSCIQKEFNLLKQATGIDCDIAGETSPLHDTKPTETSQAAASSDNTDGESKKKKDLSVVLNHLYDKQESSFITEQCLSEEISNESQYSEKGSVKDNVTLQRLESSNSGVYQTIFPPVRKIGKMDFMKTEVMEIHDILENNEAILGIDGKILVSDVEKSSILRNNYTCNVCNQKFSTKKTLIYHIRYKHNSSRLIYPCPECKETFANAWCVFRHLYKVHQKSTTQVRKLRNLIHDSAIKRSEQLERRHSTTLTSSSGSEIPENVNSKEQQWIENLEGDNDLQRCGGCGRKFERRAALHSHSQFCAKRIAICNSLKENPSKKINMEDRQVKGIKLSKTEPPQVEHVRRRKPLVAQKIQRFDDSNDVSMLEEIIGPFPIRSSSIKSNDNHDVENAPQLIDTVSPNANDISEPKIEVESNDYTQDTFYIGTVTVSKIHTKRQPTTEKARETDIENDKQVNENSNKISHNKCHQQNTSTNVENKIANLTDIISNIKKASKSNPENIISKEEEKVVEVIEVEENTIVDNTEQEMSDCGTEVCENNATSKTIVTPEVNCTSIGTNKNTLERKSLKYMNAEKQMCLPCKKRFNSFKLLMNHMALHFSWFRYQCNVCKYLSYTKAKCKHHVILKHKICDKSKLNTMVTRIPRSKTREAATNFTKHFKRKKVHPVDVNDSIQNNPKIHEDPGNLNGESIDKPVVCDNMQDPLVRQMVMEVIFGSSSDITVEPLVNLYCEDEEIKLISPGCDVDEKSVETSNHDVQNPDTTNKANVVCDSPPESLSQDYSRPVRTHIMPLRKDFLYDMKHVLKLRHAKDKKLKAKVKMCERAIRQSKNKSVSNTPPFENNTNEPSINCILHVDTNDTDVEVNHVTGDYV